MNITSHGGGLFLEGKLILIKEDGKGYEPLILVWKQKFTCETGDLVWNRLENKIFEVESLEISSGNVGYRMKCGTWCYESSLNKVLIPPSMFSEEQKSTILSKGYVVGLGLDVIVEVNKDNLSIIKPLTVLRRTYIEL